jgi:hypothetical protein
MQYLTLVLLRRSLQPQRSLSLIGQWRMLYICFICAFLGHLHVASGWTAMQTLDSARHAFSD